ncbi:MAG: hypothetical protein KKF56_03000 [Nanoarchaeota archaeon]|nr:hypothetical protein [Nanoarchaeota archaeon]
MGPTGYRIIALFLFLTGFGFFLNSSSTITGLSIVEDVGSSTSAVLGIVFIVLAIIVLIVLAKKTLGEENVYEEKGIFAVSEDN